MHELQIHAGETWFYIMIRYASGTDIYVCVQFDCRVLVICQSMFLFCFVFPVSIQVLLGTRSPCSGCKVSSPHFDAALWDKPILLRYIILWTWWRCLRQVQACSCGSGPRVSRRKQLPSKESLVLLLYQVSAKIQFHSFWSFISFVSKNCLERITWLVTETLWMFKGSVYKICLLSSAW